MSKIDKNILTENICESVSDSNTTLSESESLAFRAINAARTHCKAMILSVGIAVGSTAAMAEENTAFVPGGEYDVVQLGDPVVTPVVFSNPDVIPSSEEMSEAFPDISQTALTAFIQNFDSLGDVEKTVFLADFMNLSDTDKNMTLRIYQSAYEGVDHPMLKKVLVKVSIGIMDIIENAQFALDNGGDIRDGDAIEIMFHLENLIEKFPETRTVLDDDFLVETQVLYDTMRDAVLERGRLASERLAEAEANLEKLRSDIVNGTISDEVIAARSAELTLDDIGLTIDGFDGSDNANEVIEKLRASTQASRERNEILKEEGRRLDAFIAQLRALEMASSD